METLITKKVSIVLRAMIESETKERIQQKAKELFMQFGLRSVSMDDIANALGVSKKTIYQYFVDKDELVDAVLLEQIHHSQDGCLQANNVAANAIHEMFKAIDVFEEMVDSMNPSIMFELQKVSSENLHEAAETQE